MTADQVVTLTLRIPHGLRYSLKTHSLLTGKSINETLTKVILGWMETEGRAEMRTAAAADAMKIHGAALDALAENDGAEWINLGVADPEKVASVTADAPSELVPELVQPAAPPKTAAELSRLSAQANARNNGPSDWQISKRCPTCGGVVRIEKGQGKCTAPGCGWSGKVT
jgi:hypothetical protein